MTRHSVPASRDPAPRVQPFSWRSLRWSTASWRLAAAGLLSLLLAKGLAFLPAYSIDDYGIDLRKQLMDSPSLRQGRFGEALFNHTLQALGFEASYTHVVFVAFALITSAALGVLLVRHWALPTHGWLPFAVVALATLHPYTTEIFTFRAGLANISFVLALLTLLLVPRRWNGPLLLAGSAVFAIALSIYQGVFHYAVMIALVGTGLCLARWSARARRGAPAAVARPRLRVARLLRHRQVGLMACMAAGTVAYVLINAAIFAALGVTRLERGQLLSLRELPQRVHDGALYLRERLVAFDPLISDPARFLLLAIMAIAVVLLLRGAWPWRGRRLLAAGAALALLVAALLWTLGLRLVLQQFWPAPRIMSQVGIFWAGILTMAHRASGQRVRQLLAILVFPALLSFVGSDNRILAEQRRINARDAAMANRIVARLEAIPGLAEAHEIAVVGGYVTYPLLLRTIDHDMNISAFGATWSRAAIVREVSGLDLYEVSSGPSMSLALAYCQGADPWPAPTAVAIRGQLAIVCLSR